MLVSQPGEDRLFSKIHNLTSLEKSARFLVVGTVSRLLCGP